jgi:hypothetical protein
VPTPEEQQLTAQRQRANVRLAWTFGGIALALFFIALWKYRPL